MIKETDFATIIVMGSPENPYVAAAYAGLPPHYCALFDSRSKAKKYFNKDVIEDRYYYLGPADIYCKYASENRSLFINTLFLDRADAIDIKFAPPRNIYQMAPLKVSSSNEKNVHKSMVDREVIINDVPIYNSVDLDSSKYFSRGCVPVSAAMVLGYWDDHGYSDLIDGGGSAYAGTKYTNGYLGLINKQLGPAMGYVPGYGTIFTYCDDGTQAVCNDTNSYDFTCTYESSVSWSTFCDEIDAGRPFVLQYGSYAWIQLTDNSWFQSSDHAVTAIGYKYINGGASSSDRWRIIHFNSWAVGAPYYLCDSSFYATPTRVIIIPGGGSWSGTLDYNTIWSGNITVTGDITIPSGKILTVLDNATVTFDGSDDQSGGQDANKCELIISGTLIADNATFKSTSKGAWYGIRFQSTASSSSYLKNCTIENAKYAVCINASNPTIEECNIKSASWYGVFVTGSGAWPVVDDNYIEADTFAVYLANCGSDGGNFKFNSFKTAKYGVCITSGSPNFIDGGSDGHNKWESSIVQHRAYISGGYGYFGFDEDPGNNYLTKPSASICKYIYNSTGNTVYAANNYFDQCPDPDTDWFYGSIYRANKMGSPPSSPAAGPSWSLPKENSEFFKMLLAAKNAIHKSGIMSAKNDLIALVDEYRTQDYAALALDILLDNTSSTEMTEFNQQLISDVTVPVNVKFVVDKWSAIHRYEGGNFEFDPALKYKNTPFENEMIMINAFGLAGNRQKEDAIALIRSQIKGEDSSLIEHLVFALKMQEPFSTNGSLLSFATAQEISAESYPNPFNSETRICFYLPDENEVSVKIYNYLGQQVKTLWNGEKVAGRHVIFWDGRDDSESLVGSGIYFCRIITRNKCHIIKLSMIK